MTYNPTRHDRKSLRLRHYDYTLSGAYFVTISTQGKADLFGQVKGSELHLTQAGRLVRETWRQVPRRYPCVDIDEFVVMPNHIHGVIIMETRLTFRYHPTPMSLPDVVHRFKSLTTAKYRHGVNHRGWLPFRKRLWRRNYYERIIRNEGELFCVRRYIRNNPSTLINRAGGTPPATLQYGRAQGPAHTT